MLAFNQTTRGHDLLVSGPERVGLLELYTSEGCSSCPPADAWLSKQLTNEDLWDKFVPVAFHVDYWNQLGWPDRFASSRFSHRQRQYEDEGGLRLVYTPGFVLDGLEWRGFRRGRLTTVNAREVGTLSVQSNNGQIDVRFKPKSALNSAPNLQANIALLGFGLHTDVARGENRGRNLTHDFVVLDLSAKRLHAEAGGFVTTTQLSKNVEQAQRYALAVWISKAGRQVPLQTVGGWIADPAG